jgi:hypothetical protein
MNVEFEYQYRDLGNFKRHGSVIFGNRNCLPIQKVDLILVDFFGNDRLFLASEIEVPDMFFTEFPFKQDLDWEMHEYCAVSETQLPVNDTRKRDIVDLLAQICDTKAEFCEIGSESSDTRFASTQP